MTISKWLRTQYNKVVLKFAHGSNAVLKLVEMYFTNELMSQKLVLF